MSASRQRFPDGRWHFQHGPIDLIIQTEGEQACVHEALNRAWSRFQTVLQELVEELPTLRQAIPCPPVEGVVARRMVRACLPFSSRFITPMAAVAGAVADEILYTLRIPGVSRAYVNNGGDIALFLAHETQACIGVCTDPQRKTWKSSGLDSTFTIDSASPVRGIATSGWRGRSFSLGIADSVTVLAATAAQADAAATMIANEVNVDSAAVTRRPANTLKDETDLGDRLVTVAVGALGDDEIEQALHSGGRRAQAMMTAGHIYAAMLVLQHHRRCVGPIGERARLAS